MRRVVILGSTGSIGTNALDVLRRLEGRFSVYALTAHRNVELLSQQAEEFKPRFIVIGDRSLADRLKGTGAKILVGPEGLEEVAALPEADIVLNAREVDVVEEVDRITKEFGMDIVIELTGNRDVVNDAIRTLRRGGDIVLIGLYPGSVELDLVNNVIYKEANVYGVTGRIMWDTWWAAQTMILSGRLDLGSVITHRFDLKDYEEAFELAESAKIGKILFQSSEQTREGEG